MAREWGFKSLSVEDMLKALRRAAKRAKEDARRFGTSLVYMKDGKVVEKYFDPKPLNRRERQL